MVQVLHVLFGSIGAYFLARRLGAGVLVALIIGLTYHFQAAFFSNQQHVDIVRASAWFPWLLYSLHPRNYDRGLIGPPLGALVLSQLLISGYPGGIIAFAYSCAVWVLMLLLNEDAKYRGRYVLLVAVSVSGGILMAMPKWMPLFLNGNADINLDSFQVSPVDASELFTFFLPHDVPILPGDPTMRSLWLPLVALWGVVFAPYRDRVARIGAAFLAMGLTLCFVVPHLPVVVQILPGVRLSRFPLADWRPVISIGIALLSLSGWQTLFLGKYSPTALGVRFAGAFIFLVAFLVSAIRFGYQASALVQVLEFSAAISFITIVGCALWTKYGGGHQWRNSIFALLVFATALQGYWYQWQQPTTWRPVWTKDTEIQSFGGRFREFISHRSNEFETTRRPSRILLGSSPAEAIRFRDNSNYNKCWYMRAYCVFGYDNLRMSAPHIKLLESINGQGGGALLRFVAASQRLLLLRPGEDERVPDVSFDNESATAGEFDDVTVRFVQYGPGYVTYHVLTPRPLRVVENEIGWHGWRLARCDDRGTCTEDADVARTSQALRTWDVPPGSWTVKLHFVGPSNTPGYLLSIAGVLIALGAGIWVRRHSR
ncbi:hypothetical protein [Luteibacter sp. UNCMF366Tsu5.1]|uniref:hypothetical protein n=1 Tax=Luteibacter sp. UNCMF366Tsu5.1 TaxID=1502758 RepID=UPI0011601147|nr:hypothetical protein [Luteibacter sp. UNCMF366Tsu5.1]